MLSNKEHTCSENFLQQMAAINSRFSVSAYISKFGKLKTNLERVKFVYKTFKTNNLFLQLSEWNHHKNDDLAMKCRELGNMCFKHGNYIAALEHYIDGLMNAKSERELALLYANRSSCLFKLQRFQECITDIDRAFANNYSGKLKALLLERRSTAARYLYVMNIPAYHEETPKISADNKHPQIQSAKNCVAIANNSEFGKNIVATRNIEIGEILCVENSYAMFLVRGIHEHCYYCCELCYNPIPCKGCISAVFCSESCRDEAYDSHHKFECPILENLINCGVTSDEFLALRVAILAKQHYTELDLLNPDQNEMYRSDRYKEIHNLSTEVDKRPVEQLFHFAVVAAYMHYFLLKKTSFFNDVAKKYVFVENVFQQLLVVSLHKLPIQEDITLPHGFKTVIMAWSLYPFSSNFQHSCYPNVESIQYGSTMVLRSLNSIKKGEECFISHDGTSHQDFALISKPHLARYSVFDCKCQKCENSTYVFDCFPSFEIPLNLDLEITATELSILCLGVFGRNRNSVKNCLEKFKTFLKKLEEKESWGNVVQLKRLISICYKIFGNNRYLL